MRVEKIENMKNVSLILAFLGVMIVGFAACSTEQQVATFVIERRGDHFVDEYYDVIHVYGFGHNELVAKELVEYLNKSENLGQRKDKYRYRAK